MHHEFFEHFDWEAVEQGTARPCVTVISDGAIDSTSREEAANAYQLLIHDSQVCSLVVVVSDHTYFSDVNCNACNHSSC